MIVLVMGVTGAGKTTVGRLLAEQLGWKFADADDFHPPANVAKMRQGIGLDDSDRRPWLQNIRDALVRWSVEGQNVALACSALRLSYRRQLCEGLDVKIVYLEGSYETISEHLGHRIGHYATEALLSSQYAALEEPSPDEAMIVNVSRPPEEIVAEVRRRLDLA